MSIFPINKVSKIFRSLPGIRWSCPFVIIASGRSGSTYFESLLRSNKFVISYGEIFNLQEIKKSTLNRILENPDIYLKKEIYRVYPSDKRAVGFRLLYKQLGRASVFLREARFKKDSSNEIVEKRRNFEYFLKARYNIKELSQKLDVLLRVIINWPGLKVLHLKRKNKLAQYVSLEMARRRNLFHIRTQEGLKNRMEKEDQITVDRSTCEKYFEMQIKQQDEYDYLFSHHDKMEIIYEDLIAQKPEILDRVQKFLRIPSQMLTSDMQRTVITPLSQLIFNYKELKEYFKRTKWASYFEEV